MKVSDSFAMTAYEVQTWNGSAWVTVPGGSVTGNNKVWRRFTFAPVSTERIRVLVNATVDGYARITEVEAWTAAPVNTPPAVSLIAPGPNANFPAPATIDLAASASDAEGRVVQVEFLQSSTPIWTASQAPFTATWTNVPAGSYVLTARATDLLGTTTTSAPVAVSVGAAGSNLFFVNPDHLNTPRSIADSAGREVWRWDQGDPFGTNLPNQDADGDGQAVVYPLRFPGQYYDAETGLHYNTLRDYDPGTERYIQSDPIGLRGGINTYAYVGGSPLSSSDPFCLTPSGAQPPPPFSEGIQE